MLLRGAFDINLFNTCVTTHRGEGVWANVSSCTWVVNPHTKFWATYDFSWSNRDFSSFSYFIKIAYVIKGNFRGGKKNLKKWKINKNWTQKFGIFETWRWNGWIFDMKIWKKWIKLKENHEQTKKNRKRARIIYFYNYRLTTYKCVRVCVCVCKEIRDCYKRRIKLLVAGGLLHYVINHNSQTSRYNIIQTAKRVRSATNLSRVLQIFVYLTASLSSSTTTTTMS